MGEVSQQNLSCMTYLSYMAGCVASHMKSFVDCVAFDGAA
jgi:hypothetical protein